MLYKHFNSVQWWKPTIVRPWMMMAFKLLCSNWGATFFFNILIQRFCKAGMMNITKCYFNDFYNQWRQTILWMNYQTDCLLLSSDCWLLHVKWQSVVAVGALISGPTFNPNLHPVIPVGGMTISRCSALLVTRDHNETFIESYSI